MSGYYESPRDVQRTVRSFASLLLGLCLLSLGLGTLAVLIVYAAVTFSSR